MNQDDIYYQALCARDSRFDGKFFVGVKTTGIYCRPICPARPLRQNVVFFSNHFAAEQAGYRACRRCRPESAPASPAWIGKSAVVQRAIRILHTQETLAFDEDTFAAQFGVTARHLRRLFVEDIGKTPKQLAFENRIHLAKQLITESMLPMTEIAFAAGFTSIRRFNDAFQKRYQQTPSAVRRHKIKPSSTLMITLPYRPPFDFVGLLASYKNHQVGDLEWFSAEKMHRLVELNGIVGEVSISNDAVNSKLIVEMDFPSYAIIFQVISRIKTLFDLNSDPLTIANSLEKHPAMKKLLQRYPGIRLPSGWDPFEIAIGTILGQLVSVTFGRALVKDLIELAGRPSGRMRDGKNIKLFPSPAELLQADLTPLKTTKARRNTVLAFAQAVEAGDVSLAATQDVAVFMQSVMAIKGIGVWTASYMALKVLRHSDAFPLTDLVLAKALTDHPAAVIAAMCPWRGYAAALLWRAHGETKKTHHDRGNSL